MARYEDIWQGKEAREGVIGDNVCRVVLEEVPVLFLVDIEARTANAVFLEGLDEGLRIDKRSSPGVYRGPRSSYSSRPRH